jgi:putative hydrolase
MALIEGHAEHVMDAVGAEVLPSLARLRAELDRRRTSGPLAMRVLGRLLGLDAKVRQYVLGKRFCDAVVADSGPEGLARAFSEPAALPSFAELEDPAGWMARVL